MRAARHGGVNTDRSHRERQPCQNSSCSKFVTQRGIRERKCFRCADSRATGVACRHIPAHKEIAER